MSQNLREILETPLSHPVELCGCGCMNPLEMNDPLGPQWMEIGGKRVLVNEDCYFEKIGYLIDKHPVGGLGVHGPKKCTPID